MHRRHWLRSLNHHYLLQVHPSMTFSALKIPRAALNEVQASDAPIAFWQLEVPPTSPLRQVALRIFTLKAAASGVERLWSGARQAWSPNRRAMSSARLMQLLHVKQNLDLLEGSEYLETLGVPARALRNPVVFDSIFEELEAEENIDMLSRLSAPKAVVDTSADVPANDVLDAPAAGVDISAWF